MKITQSFFENEGVNKVSQVLYSNKCYICKKEFSKVLYNHGWNYEYLFHLKETHGLDPEIFMDILHNIIEKYEKN